MRHFISNSICLKFIWPKGIFIRPLLFLNPCTISRINIVSSKLSTLVENKMYSSSSIVKKIGEEYSNKWAELLELPAKITDEKLFKSFYKQKIHIEESLKIETYLINHFVNTPINVFHLHLSLYVCFD